MFRKLITMLVLPAAAGAQQLAGTTDTTLHPITVQEAVRLAQQNNVSAIVAENNVRNANAGVLTAKGAFMPTLTATAGQTQTGGSQVNAQGEIVPYTAAPWRYSTGLSAGMTLLDGGQRFAALAQQRATVTAQEAGQIATQFNLAFQVKQAYNSVLAAKESEAAAQSQLELANEQLATTNAKVNAGAASISDSLRSVVGVGNAQLAILTARNNLKVASASLTRLVGTPYFVTAEYADTLERPYTAIDSSAVMALALNGPQVRQTQAQLSADEAAQRSAHASYYPSLRLTYSYGGNGFDKYYGIGPGQLGYSHSLGLSASLPVFDGFSREANVERAQVTVENDQATLRDQQLAAQQAVVTDIGSLELAQEGMRIQELNVQADEEDLRVVQQRYALGASTELDVLTSQSNLVTARQQLIQARLNYRNARAQIESVIGRDLP